jgi:hypothetical protein
VAYGGGIVLALAGQQEWWLLPNARARHGLLVVVVASVLAFRSSGRSRDVTVQGEWLSHHEGCLLSGSRPLLSGPLVATSGALDPARMGEPAPVRDSHAVVVGIICLSIGIWAVLSHVG